MIEAHDRDDVRVLRIAHGKANTLDEEFFADLAEALDGAENEEISAIVLTASGHIFSAGVDLFRVLESEATYLDRFLPLFSDGCFRLFTFPKPVVAAVNGHAIAGGCILACACDTRIGASGNGRIGIPELRVGLPFPPVALEIVRFVVGDQRMPLLVLEGATHAPEEALAHGFLDAIVEPEDLLEQAVAKARRLAAFGAQNFALSKLQLRRPVLARIARERKKPTERSCESGRHRRPTPRSRPISSARFVAEPSAYSPCRVGSRSRAPPGRSGF